MSARDERRVEVLNQLLAGRLSITEAAPLLGVGERQARRLLSAYREGGPRGIIHGNRGRRPAHAVSDELRQQVVSLASGRYADVNHTHLAELLPGHEGIQVPRSTLSDILRAAGIRSPRPQKRRSRHRTRRERYPQEGMLLQTDASHHDWLEGRGPRFVLMAVIDDATGKVPAARFHETEDTAGYFLLMRELCSKTGVPHSLYSDKGAVFWPTNGETLKEQLAGRRSPTQFGRAMHELGIAMIPSHSPQSRGRIERLWGTLQDRLVSELRLAGVTTIEEANALLPGFLRRFNKTFSMDPAVPGSAYRPRRKASQLDQVLCFKHERVVQNDNTVRTGDVVLQVLPGPQRRGYAKATVTIHESLGHRFSVYYKDRLLPTRLVPLRKRLTPRPKSQVQTPTTAPTSSPANAPARKPPPSHPWKKFPAVTKSLVS